MLRCGVIMITSGEINLTTGCIAATHGWFNRICQVAPSTPSTKTCFLGPIGDQIPNGISIGSAVFAQLTAESRYTLQWAAPFALKTAPFRMWIWTPSRFCRAHYCIRPTDHTTRSVTIGHIYICNTEVWHNTNNDNNLIYNIHTVNEILILCRLVCSQDFISENSNLIQLFLELDANGIYWS